MPLGIEANSGDIILMVGTRKGGFLLAADQARRNWSVSGPHHAGSDIFHMAYDDREGGTVFAAINSPIWGPEIQRTHDLGASWRKAESNPSFADGSSDSVEQVWHVEPGRPAEPEEVYAGVAPAALFKSEDGGDTWSEIESLTAHPTRDQWQPGFGGLCLHSIVVDPLDGDRIWVGISAAGIFGTEDGGSRWSTMNTGMRADFSPDPFPEIGYCPHKMLAHPSTPERLYQQNHCGFFRSDSGGMEWLDLSAGLPSRWGMVMGVHSQDPDTVYVLPEDKAVKEGEVGGGLRYVTDAKFRVYRSRNAGEDWEPLTDGLPQRNAYLHVMREGMATDSMDECGIYVGTTTGQIFYSRNDGNTWELLIDYLPPINSVDCGTVV